MQSTVPCSIAPLQFIGYHFGVDKNKSGDHFGVWIISGSIWGSFQGWGSFRGRDHFGGCTVLITQFLYSLCHTPLVCIDLAWQLGISMTIILAVCMFDVCIFIHSLRKIYNFHLSTQVLILLQCFTLIHAFVHFKLCNTFKQ